MSLINTTLKYNGQAPLDEKAQMTKGQRDNLTYGERFAFMTTIDSDNGFMYQLQPNDGILTVDRSFITNWHWELIFPVVSIPEFVPPTVSISKSITIGSNNFNNNFVKRGEFVSIRILHTFASNPAHAVQQTFNYYKDDIEYIEIPQYIVDSIPIVFKVISQYISNTSFIYTQEDGNILHPSDFTGYPTNRNIVKTLTITPVDAYYKGLLTNILDITSVSIDEIVSQLTEYIESKPSEIDIVFDSYNPPVDPFKYIAILIPADYNINTLNVLYNGYNVAQSFTKRILNKSRSDGSVITYHLWYAPNKYTTGVNGLTYKFIL